MLLWILGKPHDALHPDAIQAAVEAAEAAEFRSDAEHNSSPPALPADPEARPRETTRQLLAFIREHVPREALGLPVEPEP